MIAAEHYLFQNTSTYCRIYLHERINLHKGDNADYLRRPFSSEWEKRLDAFDVLLTEMARKSSAAHVPLVLMEVPGLPQVALAKENNLPAGVDPNAFNDRLKKASLQQGVQFIDGLDAFKDAPEPTKLFYVIDEHLNGEGSAFVSEELVKQLIEEQHSALLSGNERQQTHSERNR
jgi:hypothetical protein